MIKVLLLFITLPLLAINIDTNFTHTNTIGSQYYEDTKSVATYNDILHERLESKTITSNLQPRQYPIWSKFTLYNDTHESKRVFLNNKKSSMDHIEVYILQSKKLIKQISLGSNNSKNISKKLHNDFDLLLQPKREYTFIISHTGISPIRPIWEIYTQERYYHQTMIDYSTLGIYVGLLFALIIYNIMNKTIKAGGSMIICEAKLP